MNECTRCWTLYMEAMALSRHAKDPRMRRMLIRTAYLWLDRYFDAEDRQVGQLQLLSAAKSRMR